MSVPRSDGATCGVSFLDDQNASGCAVFTFKYFTSTFLGLVCTRKQRRRFKRRSFRRQSPCQDTMTVPTIFFLDHTASSPGCVDIPKKPCSNDGASCWNVDSAALSSPLHLPASNHYRDGVFRCPWDRPLLIVSLCPRTTFSAAHPLLWSKRTLSP
ncbi:hypothetical protein EDD16DRAFT_422495 [Pisolithus croceorrhizus]|nr:hypothetical protein EDD16DRAFT_422495 [Pisolithus croceorrhizus]